MTGCDLNGHLLERALNVSRIELNVSRRDTSNTHLL